MSRFVATSLYFWLISVHHVFAFNFIQCPHDQSQCRDDINCNSGKMGKRAGFFCDQWPFYSGGFAECCDENWEHYTCTHSVYSHETNNVFCDFWYMTQTERSDELQLCDCKVNNGHYCTSWICATVTGYDFLDKNHSNADILSKLLLPNQIEIFGVHECGFFSDHSLISRNHEIKQFCYKYDDFKSCYCEPAEDGAPVDEYCANWVCHKYLNNAKNKLSLNRDYEDSKAGIYHNYWNISSETERKEKLNISSSAIDMMLLSTKVTHEEYRCTNSYSNTDRISASYDVVDKTECVEWVGSVYRTDGTSFNVQECGTEGWNSDTSTFTQIADKLRGYNMTFNDLVDTYSYKWQCHLKSMDMRNNSQFLNFYLSTIIWSICVGGIGLFLIFKYMQYKYITLSSFFCVQGWFLFIFGSIAAVHGGLASFVIYFIAQLPVLVNIIWIKCKTRGKQPYGSLSQRYEFEESVSVRQEDAKL